MKIPIKDHNDFFKVFGTETKGIELPASNTQEQNVIAFAEHFEDITEDGQGMFFDFTQTPELEKPVLNYLINDYGWILEKPYFIRKPKHK